MRRYCLLLLFAIQLIRVHGAVLAEFPFEYREGLLWIQVTSPASAEPLNFLVDTGAGVTAINLAAAKRIGLRLGRKVSVQAVHARLTGHWQQKIALKLGNLQLPSECLAVDLGKLSCSCDRPVDGLLGADFFRGRITEIDFASLTIRTLDAVKTSETDITLPLDVRSCGMRVPISVNGGPKQFFRVDTGCASALQWVTSEVPDRCTKQVAIGLAELAIPETRTTVGLGPRQFKDVPTGLHKTPIFAGESGLLGNGILSSFAAVIIEAKDGAILLRN